MRFRYPLPYSVPLLRSWSARYQIILYHGVYVETPLFRLYIGSKVCYDDHYGWGLVWRCP